MSQPTGNWSVIICGQYCIACLPLVIVAHAAAAPQVAIIDNIVLPSHRAQEKLSQAGPDSPECFQSIFPAVAC